VAQAQKRVVISAHAADMRRYTTRPTGIGRAVEMLMVIVKVGSGNRRLLIGNVGTLRGWRTGDARFCDVNGDAPSNQTRRAVHCRHRLTPSARTAVNARHLQVGR